MSDETRASFPDGLVQGVDALGGEVDRPFMTTITITRRSSGA